MFSCKKAKDFLLPSPFRVNRVRKNTKAIGFCVYSLVPASYRLNKVAGADGHCGVAKVNDQGAQNNISANLKHWVM